MEVCVKRLILAFIVVMSACFLTIEADADRRPFVWTYIYAPGHIGAVEVENYLTFDTKSLTNITNTSVEYQFEVETGLGGGWDFALYNVFVQSPGGSMKYDKTKFRFRYVLAEENVFLIDPQLYMEYQLFASLVKHKFEFKIILSKELDYLVFGINPVYELQVDYYDIPKHELKLIDGLSLKITEGILLGAESEFKYEIKGNQSKSIFSVGPTLSVGSSTIWLNTGVLFNLIDNAMKLRFLLSFYL